MKRIAGSGIVLLLLPVFGLAAGPVEIADALMRGDTGEARKLIQQHGDVNAAQPDGATPLHWAVYRSNQEMVDLLLRAGANPKVANQEGSTPLWLACTNGNAGIVAALLKAGAD